MAHDPNIAQHAHFLAHAEESRPSNVPFQVGDKVAYTISDGVDFYEQEGVVKTASEGRVVFDDGLEVSADAITKLLSHQIREFTNAEKMQMEFNRESLKRVASSRIPGRTDILSTIRAMSGLKYNRDQMNSELIRMGMNGQDAMAAVENYISNSGTMGVQALDTGGSKMAAEFNQGDKVEIIPTEGVAAKDQVYNVGEQFTVLNYEVLSSGYMLTLDDGSKCHSSNVKKISSKMAELEVCPDGGPDVTEEHNAMIDFSGECPYCLLTEKIKTGSKTAGEFNLGDRVEIIEDGQVIGTGDVEGVSVEGYSNRDEIGGIWVTWEDGAGWWSTDSFNKDQLRKISAANFTVGE